jgi:hypothetical protein
LPVECAGVLEQAEQPIDVVDMAVSPACHA